MANFVFSGPVFTWTKVFDNALSPWFSLFISTWVTVLPPICFAWRWFTTDFEQIEVKRPQFQATETRFILPMRKRITRQTISWIFVAICMFTCVALNGAEVLGGIMLSRPLESETAMAAVICGLGLAGIMFFKNPSRYFAHFLNEWENYRTESNYDDAIILKTYALDFINYYSLLFYFSIVKPNLHYHGLWAFPDSQCQGLLIISIFILFIGGQILERFEELVIPWLINKSAEIITAVRLQYRWKRMIKERHRRESHVFRGADSFVRSPTPLPMPHIDAVIHSNHPPPQPATAGFASLGTSVPSLDISEAPIVNKAGSNLKLSQNSFGSVGVRRALSVGSADPSRYTSSGHIATRNQLKSISFKSSNSTSSGKATPKQSTANASAAYLNPSSAPPAEPAQPSPQQLMELAFFSLSSMSTDDYVEQIRGGSVNATSRRMSIDVQGFRGAAQSNSANANRAKLSKIRLPQFYRDDKLVPFSGIRDEFSQKIIQLGYIAMFSCCSYGIWSNILKFVANASVLTNSAIIAFNSPSFELLFLDGFDDTGSRFAARFTFIIAFHYCVHLLVTAF
ncbi:calcium-activated chloride channel-domain-containing protein, partial [Chytridium lagenaria]